jgi:hypothetical protein
MSRLEPIKSFIADLARPFAIYAASVSGLLATVVVAQKVTTAEGGALVLGAIGLTWTSLYAGKAIEETRKSGHAAEVEKVRAQASPPSAEALKAPKEERSLEDPA